MDGLSAERCLALRAEASWRSSLKLPEEPPWVYLKAATTLNERPKQGIVRRPQIYPPPLHIPAAPPNTELAEQEPGASEFRRRLEERFKDDVSLRRDGYVVFDDAAAYSVPSSQNSQIGRARVSVLSDSSTEVPTLSFESRFESGNLRKAVQVGPREYDLSLRPDKDSGHVQWYYFMVGNVRSGVPYVFNIVNFVKQKSLYNQGLKPLLYSSMDAKNKDIGWQRTGSKCAYYSRSAKYTLTFTIQFQNDGDTCFLAHCYPYTYTDLQLFLSALESNTERRQRFTRKELCRSLADNRVDLITITEKSDEGDENEPRKAILLTARVHPGETQASWSMQGCIQFLTSNDPAAKLLRQRFTIYVVPMLNPDGVINGHYRCSLAGQDLNRLWADPDIARHPCIWHVKNLVRQLVQKGLVFFCDFHGHSTKRNAFMYGCEPPANKNGEGKLSSNPSAVFPSVLAELSPAFSLNDCDYKIQKNKVTTGRVVVSREFSIVNSYTLEVSFLGHKVGTSLVHFNLEDLIQLGHRFGDALVKYHMPTTYEEAAIQREKNLITDVAKETILELEAVTKSGSLHSVGTVRTHEDTSVAFQDAGDLLAAVNPDHAPDADNLEDGKTAVSPGEDGESEVSPSTDTQVDAEENERDVGTAHESTQVPGKVDEVPSELSGWKADQNAHELAALDVSAQPPEDDAGVAELAATVRQLWEQARTDEEDLDKADDDEAAAAPAGQGFDAGEDSDSSSEHASVGSDAEAALEDVPAPAAPSTAENPPPLRTEAEAPPPPPLVVPMEPAVPAHAAHLPSPESPPALLPKISSRGASPDTEVRRASRPPPEREGTRPQSQAGAPPHASASAELGRSLRTGGLWPKGASMEADRERSDREARREQSKKHSSSSSSEAGEGAQRPGQPQPGSTESEHKGGGGGGGKGESARWKLSSRGSLRSESADGEGEAMAAPRFWSSRSSEPNLWKARSDGNLGRLLRPEERGGSDALERANSGVDLSWPGPGSLGDAGSWKSASDGLRRGAHDRDPAWTLTASRRPTEDSNLKGPGGKDGTGRGGPGGPAAATWSNNKWGSTVKLQMRHSLAANPCATRQAAMFPPRQLRSAAPANAAAKQRPHGVDVAEPSRRERLGGDASAAPAPAQNAAPVAPREGPPGLGWWAEGALSGMGGSWRRHDKPQQRSIGAAPWGVLGNSNGAMPQGGVVSTVGLPSGLLGTSGSLAAFPSVSLPSIVPRELGEAGAGALGPGAGMGEIGVSQVARLLALNLQPSPQPRPLLHGEGEGGGIARAKSGRPGEVVQPDGRALRLGGAAVVHERSGSPVASGGTARREDRESPTGKGAGRDAMAARSLRLSAPAAGGGAAGGKQLSQPAPLTPGGSRQRATLDHVSLPKPTLVFE